MNAMVRCKEVILADQWLLFGLQACSPSDQNELWKLFLAGIPLVTSHESSGCNDFYKRQ